MIKKLVKKILKSRGYSVIDLKNTSKRYPVEFTKFDKEIFDYILNNQLTMVSNERLISTILSAKYILENDIPGDFIECGVWRGGNSIAMKFLLEEYNSHKKLYLFDTFKGMTEPTNNDIRINDNTNAFQKFKDSEKKDFNEWCYSPIEEVKENFKRAGLNFKNLKFIQGPVEDTLKNKENIPSEISLLRLDTDWYESTEIGMRILFPKLSQNGLLLLDDYGHWGGAKKAVDEYFDLGNNKIINFYVDYTGRQILKLQ